MVFLDYQHLLPINVYATKLQDRISRKHAEMNKWHRFKYSEKTFIHHCAKIDYLITSFVIIGES